MIKGQGRARFRTVSLVMLTAVIWGGVAAVPAFSSCQTIDGDTICGRIDGFLGDCDGPGTFCNAGSGFVEVVGYALASTGVHRVEVLIESVQFPGNIITLGRATYGSPRPDAAEEYPGFPDEPNFGWSYNINSPLFANGQYDVWVKITSVSGASKELAPKQVLFTNNEAVLRPFGEIERPGQNEDVFGTCDRGFCGDFVCEIGLGENCLNCPNDCNGQELGLPDDFCCGYDGGRNPLACDERQPPAFPGGPSGQLVCQQFPGRVCSEVRQTRYAVVDGYALDLGLSGEDAGIAWVELETNGALVGNTRTSCEFNRRLGGLTNCYGLPRLDLENRFPFAFDAPSAGYRFVLDVGAMLNEDLVTHGSNELIVRAGDWAAQFEDIDRVSVNFLCEEDFSEPAFGEIEAPREGRLYTGDLSFQGWALDGEGVKSIDLFIDGEIVATLILGAATDGMGIAIPGGFAYDDNDPEFDLPGGFGTRPLVNADYPGFQDSDAPVWQLTRFDTTKLTNGFHTLQVRVTDRQGDSNFIGGEVTFRVDNSDFAILGLYK